MRLNVLPTAPSRPGFPTVARALARMASNVARFHLGGEDALLRPLFVSWEINSVCNLRCPYCYLNDRSYAFTDRGLSFEEMKVVLRRIDAVTEDVMLLGGEPFLHPAWDRVVDHCRDELDLRVRCITNGTRLEHHLRTVGRLDLLVVSYDQTREETYPERMADVRAQLDLVARTYPDLTILVNFVLCAQDDPSWVAGRIEGLTDRGYNVFVNVDRYFGPGRVDPRIVASLKRTKRANGRVHMTDRTLEWLEDTREPVPFCSPTLLPLLDPQARLIYPCCYHDEQAAGSLLDTDYDALLRASARRFGRYPFEKCSSCSTTAYLDASVAVRKPAEAVRHYHRLYNR